MKINRVVVVILVLIGSSISLASDLDESIQGSPTTVTRDNLCVSEKLKSYNPIKGTIPLAFGHYPATDLLCDSDECGAGVRIGEVLSPLQAKNYYLKRFEETRCQWSLADLHPKENSDVWKDYIGVKLDKTDDNLGINDLDKVSFISEAWSRLGNYRMTVNKDNQFGTPIQYSVILSKTVHNFILRKSLLRKLGYKVPPVKYVPRLKVAFETNEQVKEFIKNLSINNAGSFDRWVLNQTKYNEVILQDVIVMEDQEFSLNLAKGYISQDVSQGKRIFNSLLVPFSMVEVPESINMFDWTFGRVYSNNLVVKFPLASEYNTSYSDALWMARRIIKLTENDWWDIVKSTFLPPSVKLLLFEKLKSRRNHLAQLFNIQTIEFKFNSKVSNQDDLVDGEIVKEFYDGFARRFKIPDPESPLSYSEMISFFKSKALSTGIKLLVNAVNSTDYLGTNVGNKVDEEIKKIMAENVAKSAVTGSVTKTPVKAFVFPTASGNLVLNREIITGTYLGTDNMIQLVDTIGANISAGLFGGVTGIYTKTGSVVKQSTNSIRQKVPVSLTNNTQVSLGRTYSHVRPIKSIQKALKYPFKNMFVPYLKKNFANVFTSLLSEDFQEALDEDKEKGLSKMLDLLNENMNIGESIIVTDNLGASLNLGAGFNLYEVMDLKLGVKPAKIIISRLHILRKSETEFHVYKSLGNVNSISISKSVEKYIPITKLTYKMSKGIARTKYYRFSIGDRTIDGSANAYQSDYIKALSSVFATGSLHGLNSIMQPYVLSHKFQEDSTKFGILLWRWNWMDHNDNISIFDPKGNEINLFKRMEAKSSGRDIENYVKDIVHVLSGKLFGNDYTISSFSKGNPGFTFLGKAKNSMATFESYLDKKGNISQPFIRYSKIWNGWKLSQEKAIDKIKYIKKRYGHDFFEEDDLAQTKELFLYNLNVNFFVYSKGIEYARNLSSEKIDLIWQTFSRNSKINFSARDKFKNAVKWYNLYAKDMNSGKMAKMAIRMLKVAESNLVLKGIGSLFGGGNNIFSVGKIDGFRIGDENGDERLESSTFGRADQEQVNGPLGSLKQYLGITTGEFYINWLLGRVI